MACTGEVEIDGFNNNNNNNNNNSAMEIETDDRQKPKRMSRKAIANRESHLKVRARDTVFKIHCAQYRSDYLNWKNRRPLKEELFLYVDLGKLKLSDTGVAAPTPGKRMMQPAPAPTGGATSPVPTG